MARKITHVVIHCSATRQGKVITAADIDRMHRQRGFDRIGYHYFIRLDGTVEKGRPEEVPGAHVAGHNATTIGICYAGGLDANGKPKDTRTQAQRAAMVRVVLALIHKYRGAKVVGHRDLSPDRDGDGKVEKHEWLKDCPCFDVSEWMIEAGI